MGAVVPLVLAILPLVLFVLWPLFRGDTGQADAAQTVAAPASAETAIESRKRAAMAAIKEAEFDRRVGKLSEEDFAELVQQYRRQAVAAMAALEDAAPAPTGARHSLYCAACGTETVAEARFCGACGAAVAG